MSNLKKILPRNVRGKLMDALWWVPDKPYIQLFYFSVIGKLPNLKHPQGYNEKLQWLKLHEDYSKYRDYCDKLKVREIIREKLGDGYMFPVLGQWKSFDEIDFDSLPNEFVLKCNHDSGSVKIIRDKSALTEEDFRQLRKFYESRLKYDFFYAGREPCYKGIERFVFAEQYMRDSDAGQGGIKDYKFFCFDGKPQIMFIATDRAIDVKFDFFDMNFNHLDITNIHPQSGKTLQKPVFFEEMKRIAEKLSAGMKFVRIDLFELNGKIYFSEFTFFHGGGFNRFYPEEWEKKLGDMIQLN